MSTDTATPGAVSVQLRFIGATRLHSGDGRTHELERHDAVLLALLALEGSTSRHRIAELLWPQAEPPAAARNLRQRLFRLRRIAAAPLVEGTTELRLADSVRHDLDSATAVDLGNAADELLTGVKFADHIDLTEWLERTRALWRERRHASLADEAAAAESAGEPVRALRLAQRLLALVPGQESAHQRVIRLLYLQGDRAAALAAYRACEQQLRRDLGVEPSVPTQALLRMIEAGEPPRPVLEALSTTTLQRPPRLVGRAQHCAAIQQAFDAGALVLIEGEAGIGKSRLLGEFAVREPACAQVIALAGDAAQPYALLDRLLRALVSSGVEPEPGWVRDAMAAIAPLRAAAPAQPTAAIRLAEAVDFLLTQAASAGLSLVLVDDLHHADGPSLQVLLTQAAQVRPLRWLLAVRSGERPAPLEAWLRGLPSDRLYRLQLGSLDLAGLEELVRSLDLPVRWTEALWQRTAGHPFLALQTLLACSPQQRLQGPPDELPLPTQVSQWVDRHIETLPAASLRLVQIAAVAGPSFSVPLAAAVLQVHAVDLAPAWREAEERQIVRGHLFAHDLMREAVLRTLPSAIASELHGQIAAVGPSFAMPARLRAMHLEHAGQPGPAAQEYAAAALDAGRRGAWLAALQLWDRAAACERARADDGRAFAAERTAAAIALEVCDLEQGQHRIDDLLARAGSGRQRAQALVLVARSAVSRASFDEAHSAASAALEARDVLTDIDVAQAAGLLGLSLSVLNRTDEALALFDSHESVLERLGDRWVRSEFRSAQAYALAQRDRLRQAVAYWEEAAQGAFEAGRVGDAVVNLNNAAGTSSYLGRFEQALAMAERALFWQRSMSTPHTLVQASATMLMGTLHTALGRFEQAHDQLLRALQDWQGEGSRVWRVVAENCLCNLYHLLGQEARARQALRTPLAVGESGFARRQILLTRLGGRASAERLQPLQEAIEHPAPTDRAIGRFAALLARATLLPVEHRLPALRALMREAEQREHLSVLQHGLAREADALRQLGRHRQAARSALRAVSMADAACLPHDLYLGEFWWLVHQALQAAGHRQAATALSRGEAWVRDQALPHVPDVFRDSFLNRNAVNRQLLAAAQRARAR